MTHARGRRLSVPRTDGSLLCVPPFETWETLVEENVRRASHWDRIVGGVAFSELRAMCRRDSIQAAAEYMHQQGQPVDLPSTPSIVVAAGHQPELYHPGVWIKSFAVAQWSARLAAKGAVGINVLVDNDAIKRTSIAVPAGDPAAPLLAHVPFDRWESEIPYEERLVLDDQVFARFPRAVHEQIARYDFSPILPEFWEQVELSRPTARTLGERFAWGRRAIERAWGCRNLEIPLSRLASGDAFRRLTAELLLDAERFADVHNECLAEYRRLNHVRSSHHPVPAMEKSVDGAVECPFWLWRSDDPRRRRAMIRRRSGRLELLADGRLVVDATIAGVESLADALQQLPDGWKIRPRALTTTMLLRLLLADLFVHGVGGAKYDELGDEIVRRFWSMEPTDYATLSATALLPVRASRRFSEQLAELRSAERDFRWNPDRRLPEALRDQEPIAGWVERKYELRESQPNDRLGKRARFDELRQINAALARYLGRLPDDVEAERLELQDLTAGQALLQSREFAFCLHDRASLKRLFHSLSGAGSSGTF